MPAKVDIDKISTDLSEALVSISNLLSGEEVQGLISQVEKLANQLETLSKTLDSQLGNDRLVELLNEYKAAGTDLRNLIASAEKQMAEIKLDQTSSDIRDGVGDIRKGVTDLRSTMNGLRTTMTKLRSSLSTFDSTATTITKELEAANLDDTSASARHFLNSSTNTTRTLNDTQRELRQTLSRANEAIAAFKEFVTYLDEDPSSLLRGKQKSPAKAPTP